MVGWHWQRPLAPHSMVVREQVPLGRALQLLGLLPPVLRVRAPLERVLLLQVLLQRAPRLLAPLLQADLLLVLLERVPPSLVPLLQAVLGLVHLEKTPLLPVLQFHQVPELPFGALQRFRHWVLPLQRVSP